MLRSQPDIICFSHLRWGFVYQRPQHLMTRFAHDRRVFFIEEPVFGDGPARLKLSVDQRSNVAVVVPYLPAVLDEAAIHDRQQRLLGRLLLQHDLDDYVAWYFTPMARPSGRRLDPVATVFDCMDELSAFKDAPNSLLARERELMQAADVMFTGGQSIYERKCTAHANVHAMPSSVDAAHFMRARDIVVEPDELREIPHPRLGYCGVIDERMDLALLSGIADRRAEWHIVMVGPIVKIDEALVPRRANIHYLGERSYQDLPSYLAAFDVALLPFAMNESTRYISPTKTPEYLAAGKPVVSSPVRDVVRPYGEKGLARIADGVDEFVQAIGSCLAEDDSSRQRAADALLATMSWDTTFARMLELVDAAVARNERTRGQPGRRDAQNREDDGIPSWKS